MASKRAFVPAKHLFTNFSAQQPTLTRSMATEAPLPTGTSTLSPPPSSSTIHQPPPNPFRQPTQCTLYTFPTLEPTGFATYPSTHLLLPTRKDILHKAITFEGDNARSGTASTKWRSEVHGSGRKIRPQKGSGKARLGDKKSPMLRGGGVAFGPKPRDFGTDLPKKMYDLAFRTALSHRYKKGELIVVDDSQGLGLEIAGVHENSMERYVRDVLGWNGLERSLFVSRERRDGLFTALEADGMQNKARAMEVEWVDVKDLLAGGRVVVEKSALEALFREHEEDLAPKDRLRPFLRSWSQGEMLKAVAAETRA
ncbi:unnamed protein product [Zymoseptoria tritici ST99CH_3D7]|uniref:Large ribosomal subunit protein uL4m n=1 Tax=Zymoseptoria tritici (strain ST99CH_3D7) TaxID=1276538 RepID=A0A1X7RJA7_ZYMT9|nr:unnamed protein product [Zymoseptoria tritici ST99CH_3D7]